jgi:hypothetical protein
LARAAALIACADLESEGGAGPAYCVAIRNIGFRDLRESLSRGCLGAELILGFDGKWGPANTPTTQAYEPVGLHHGGLRGLPS